MLLVFLEYGTIQRVNRAWLDLSACLTPYMFKCPVCPIELGKRKDLDTHLLHVHPENLSPYGCSTCSSSFSSEKAAKHHAKKHRPPEKSKIDTQAPKRQRIEETQMPFIGTVTDWVHARYNPSRTTLAEQLASSTISRIDGFSQRLRFEDDQTLLQLLSTNEEGKIVDAIDSWLDLELHSHAMQTVNNHLRYLNVLVLFHDATEHVDDTIIEYLADLVADTQMTTTRVATTLNILKLEDPFALVRIRDTVVNALRKEQIENINPYILNNILHREDTNADHATFGIRLRNWLELVIRFTNIPCRIQCTREMQLPSSSTMDYVSKLVLREEQYCRILNRDKSSFSHQPLLIPLGRFISTYLHIYITYCRPKVEHSFVFCSGRGAQWTRPSRDLKRYMEDILGISVHDIDPTGRFIHGSRSIMMAVFAVGVHFDQQKMHGFARLMRHSSTTNERFYSMWQQRALSNQSIDVFAQMMSLDFTSVTTTPMTYKPIQLQPIPARLTAVFLHGFDAYVTHANVIPCYGTRSVGTQTGPADGCTVDDTVLPEIDIAETQPRCKSCGIFSLQLYGPFGSIRRKRYFGRYYLACIACNKNDEGRFDLQKCLWFPLGYQPEQVSKSNRPRNMKEILEFIATHKG
jgi:hypothetical protein